MGQARRAREAKRAAEALLEAFGADDGGDGCPTCRAIGRVCPECGCDPVEVGALSCGCEVFACWHEAEDREVLWFPATGEVWREGTDAPCPCGVAVARPRTWSASL